jgi:predicted HD phosphohydrolase
MTADKSTTVSFRAMKDGSFEDYQLLAELETDFHNRTADRLLQALRLQGNETLDGYKISRMEHGLQAATRARRDGADVDWVVAALLHDIGDGLAPQNHDKMAAEIFRPFVREEVTWVVEHHGMFQMIYYGHHYGWDREERQKFKDHPYYQSAVDFCERWDQSSFDETYESDPLTSFEPLVHEVFSRKAYSPSVLKSDIVSGVPIANG